MEQKSKKHKILESALELFAEKGYTSSKIVDIAIKAGIGKGTVYEYFSSKDEIVLELINSFIMKEYEPLEEKMGMNLSFKEKMGIYLDFKVAFLMKYGRYIEEVKEIFSNPASDVAKNIFNAAKAMIEKENAIMLRLIEEGIDNGEIKAEKKSSVQSFIAGAIFSYVTSNTEVLNEFHKLHGNSGMNEEIKMEAISKDEFFDFILNGIGEKK